DLGEDPVVAGYRAAALSPLGPADRHELLCAATAGARLDRLRELLRDQIELREARLAAPRRRRPTIRRGGGPGVLQRSSRATTGAAPRCPSATRSPAPRS